MHNWEMFMDRTWPDDTCLLYNPNKIHSLKKPVYEKDGHKRQNHLKFRRFLKFQLSTCKDRNILTINARPI
jgi:hypothetical protein